MRGWAIEFNDEWKSTVTKKYPKVWYHNLAYPSFMEGVMVGWRWSAKRRVREYTLQIGLSDCCGTIWYTLTESRVRELWKFLSGHYAKKSRHFPCSRQPEKTFCVTRNFGPDIVYKSTCCGTNRIRLSHDDLRSLLDFLKMFMAKCEELKGEHK